MSAPKCKLCGYSHWSHEGHKFDAVANKPVVVVNSKPAVVNKSRTKDRHKDKDKRREYMREYMRRKRA